MPSRTQAKTAPTKSGSNRVTVSSDSATALGLAGWLVAAELLNKLRERGVISGVDGLNIIDRALADAEALDAQLTGPPLNGALLCLERFLAATSADRTRRPRRVQQAKR
jgi:hypothetical protein